MQKGAKITIEQARRVLAMEADAINKMSQRMDESFEKAVNLILSRRGRVIVTGMGKSGFIGQKMAATMSSTGTPSLYMHPAEGIHGDLGMVTPQDTIIAISFSGETAEVIGLLPTLKRIGVPIITMCGQADSTLVRNGDVALDVSIEQEACPLGLAPTTSTTVALAMGDALAVVLLSKRNFTSQDFALYHPGGSLGKKLLLTVARIMHSGDGAPIVTPDTTVKTALFVITDKGLGAAMVANKDGVLQGLITDGDIRRGLERGDDFLNQPVSQLMTASPKTISGDKLAAEAMHVMENNQPRPITVLPVVDANNKVQGILHITDLLRQGVI